MQGDPSGCWFYQSCRQPQRSHEEGHQGSDGRRPLGDRPRRPKTGTAEDSHGDTYHFVYTNRAAFNVSPGLPAIVNVRMTDNFRLKGHGLHMHVSFDVSWDYPAPNGVDITLEPLAFVPAVPFVVGTDTEKGATNFQLLSIQGDAFSCDPL